MANTFTPGLRLTKVQDQSSLNVWGSTLNSNMELAEQAIAGVLNLDVTSLDATLVSANGSPDQARYGAFRATGNPGVTRSVIVPNTVRKMFIGINDTTGGYAVFFRTSSQSNGIEVLPGEAIAMWVDTDNNLVRPVGSSGTGYTTHSFTGIHTLSFSAPTIPASAGTLSVRLSKYGNIVVGRASLNGAPVLSTGDIVFDTSPFLTAEYCPPNSCDFIHPVNDAGVFRNAFLRVATLGNDWTINRISGTFGVATARSTLLFGQPFFYSTV